MGRPATIEFDALLAPISEEEAAGTDLRSGGDGLAAFRDLRDKRQSARDAERAAQRAAGEPDEGAATWRDVAEAADAILKDHSKDFEVCSMLIEALLRTEGFAGLRDGFSLCDQLAQQYWSEMYPGPDPDPDPDYEEYGVGVVEKVMPIVQLNGEDRDGLLVFPISQLPLLPNRGGDAPAYWQAEAAHAGNADQAGGATQASIQSFLGGAPESTLVEELETLNECHQAFRDMVSTLDDLCQQDAEKQSAEGDEGAGFRAFTVSSSKLDGILDNCVSTFEVLTEGMITDPDAQAVSDEDGEPADAPTASAQGGGSFGTESLASREDAFRAIERIATFFERTEPHSPVSSVLRNAVRMGRMDLADLMEDLLEGYDSARDDLFRLAGIRRPGDGYSGDDSG